MRIDCQSHIFPDAYIEILAQNPHPPQVIRSGSEAVVTYGDVQTFRLQDDAYDPKRKLKDMDEAGVDMALLSVNIPPPCMLAPELGNRGAQAINDAIAELVDIYRDRFAGLACLPWQNPDEAITEMDRVQQLGFRGIMLYSHIGGNLLTHQNLDSSMHTPKSYRCRLSCIQPYRHGERRSKTTG